MTITYKVREMKAEDIEAVAEIETELFSDGWSQGSLESSLTSENVKMIVAELDNRVVGYHIFYMSIDEGDVARIAVCPSYRRMGIADQLLEYIWIYCAQSGITRVLLEVRESNANAIALYEKHGFSPIGLRKNYYASPLEHGVIMEKRLDITTSYSTVRSI